MKIIGLDVGEKRIGVARADSDTRIAIPQGFIEVDGSEWQEITQIANKNNTTFFVIGLPRSNEGVETAQSLYVRNFAKTLLEKVPNAKIRFQDESLTSVEAEDRLKSRKNGYKKGEVDAEAASIILQDFMENFQTPEQEPIEETNLIERKVDEARLKTKKAVTWASGISGGVIILALIATGAFFLIKEQRARERAEYYAQLEAQMEADVFDFTIRPGETIFDVKKNLIEAGYEATEVEEAFGADYDFAFLQSRPEGATLEGYLFGETHEFYRSATVKEILREYLTGMDKVITENGLEAKYAEQGLSLHEGITLASVVQKEASASEHPTVAQVFLSRLAYGIPLGSDVTVSYALDVVDPDRQTYSDNQSALKVDSCYNTRLYAGLPCGPISNPGLSALLAVGQPSNTSYLYFLTGDDGVMYYSNTEAEHNQNAALHCQNLCNVSL